MRSRHLQAYEDDVRDEREIDIDRQAEDRRARTYLLFRSACMFLHSLRD